MKEVLIPKHWVNICNLVKPIVLENIFPYIKSNRVRSGCLSELFENISGEYFNSIGINTKVCDNDSEPDLFFTDLNKPCEIKVTSSNKQEWMGGKLSKRSSDFVLISWKYQEGRDTLFGYEPENIDFSVISVYIHQSEWDTLGENYYATKITSKLLKDKKIEILVEGLQEKI